MSWDTTSNLIRYVFDISHFSSNCYLENECPHCFAFWLCLVRSFGICLYISAYFAVESISLSCHLMFWYLKWFVVLINTSLFLYFLQSSIDWLWSIRVTAGEEALLTPLESKETIHSCLSGLWHLCKFPNICKNHREDVTHYQSSRICDSSLSCNYIRQHFDGSGFHMCYCDMQSTKKKVFAYGIFLFHL